MQRLTIVTLASACLLAATPVLAHITPTTSQTTVTAPDMDAAPTILASCGSKAKKGIT